MPTAPDDHEPPAPPDDTPLGVTVETSPRIDAPEAESMTLTEPTITVTSNEAATHFTTLSLYHDYDALVRYDIREGDSEDILHSNGAFNDGAFSQLLNIVYETIETRNPSMDDTASAALKSLIYGYTKFYITDLNKKVTRTTKLFEISDNLSLKSALKRRVHTDLQQQHLHLRIVIDAIFPADFTGSFEHTDIADIHGNTFVPEITQLEKELRSHSSSQGSSKSSSKSKTSTKSTEPPPPSSTTSSVIGRIKSGITKATTDLFQTPRSSNSSSASKQKLVFFAPDQPEIKQEKVTPRLAPQEHPPAFERLIQSSSVSRGGHGGRGGRGGRGSRGGLASPTYARGPPTVGSPLFTRPPPTIPGHTAGRTSTRPPPTISGHSAGRTPATAIDLTQNVSMSDAQLKTLITSIQASGSNHPPSTPHAQSSRHDPAAYRSATANSTQSNVILNLKNLPADVRARRTARLNQIPIIKSDLQPYSTGLKHHFDMNATGNGCSITCEGYILYHKFEERSFLRNFPLVPLKFTTDSDRRNYYNKVHNHSLNHGLYIPSYYALFQGATKNPDGFDVDIDIPSVVSLNIGAWQSALVTAINQVFVKSIQWGDFATATNGYDALKNLVIVNHPNATKTPLNLIMSPPVQKRSQSIQDFHRAALDFAELQSYIEDHPVDTDRPQWVERFLLSLSTENKLYLCAVTREERLDPTNFAQNYTGTRLPNTLQAFLHDKPFRFTGTERMPNSEFGLNSYNTNFRGFQTYRNNGRSSTSSSRPTSSRYSRSDNSDTRGSRQNPIPINQIQQDEDDWNSSDDDTADSPDILEDLTIHQMSTVEKSFRRTEQKHHKASGNVVCILCSNKDGTPHFFRNCPYYDPKDGNVLARMVIGQQNFVETMKSKARKGISGGRKNLQIQKLANETTEDPDTCETTRDDDMLQGANHDQDHPEDESDFPEGSI